MAERQAKQILQERAKRQKKAKRNRKQITNLLSFQTTPSICLKEV